MLSIDTHLSGAPVTPPNKEKLLLSSEFQAFWEEFQNISRENLEIQTIKLVLQIESKNDEGGEPQFTLFALQIMQNAAKRAKEVINNEKTEAENFLKTINDNNFGVLKELRLFLSKTRQQEIKEANENLTRLLTAEGQIGKLKNICKDLRQKLTLAINKRLMTNQLEQTEEGKDTLAQLQIYNEGAQLFHDINQFLIADTRVGIAWNKESTPFLDEFTDTIEKKELIKGKEKAIVAFQKRLEDFVKQIESVGERTGNSIKFFEEKSRNIESIIDFLCEGNQLSSWVNQDVRYVLDILAKKINTDLKNAYKAILDTKTKLLLEDSLPESLLSPFSAPLADKIKQDVLNSDSKTPKLLNSAEIVPDSSED